MNHRVKSVIALMKVHLHQGWPASRWAQFVNLSPSRLHQLFKDETGLPPARYLRVLRMERARELLETTYLSVKEVMARVGLADESHFVRDFKKSYGFTPAKYRERSRQDKQHNAGTAASSVSNASTHPPSPLLLRRPSHPRHLTQDEPPLLRARKKRELLSLVRQRHLAFADLTARITDNLARTLSKKRAISYQPRRSTVPRRPPPSLPHISPANARRSPGPRAPRRRPVKSANEL